MIRANILVSLAKEQGMHPQAVSDILTIIDVHPDLVDLPRSIMGFRRVLDAADQYPQLEIQGRDKNVWDEACEWLISLRGFPAITEILGDKFWLGDTPPSRNPVKNQGDGVRVFGFPYAALWFKPKDLENSSDHYRLIAQLLVSFQRSKSAERLSTQRYELYRLIEGVSSNPNLYIPSQLGIWRAHGAFVRACQELEPRHLKLIFADNFAPVTRTVRYFNGKRPAVRSGGRGRFGPRATPTQVTTHEVNKSSHGFALADPDDPDQLPGFYTIAVLGAADTDDRLDPGELAPNELTPAEEIWLLDDDGLDRPYVEDLISAQNVEAHIIRSRQILPFSYNLFTLTELRNLLFGIGDLFEICLQQLNQSAGSAYPRLAALELKMETMLLIHIALWLGQPITQISQMRIAEDTKEDLSSTITFIRGTPDLFRVLVRSPTLTGDDRHQAQSGIREAATNVLLPDLAESATLINTLLRVFPRESNAVFTNQSDVLEAEAKQLLRTIGGGDARYTLTKVRNYLYAQICSDTGDVAVAAMLSGVVNPSAENPQYYLQPRASKLCELYVRTLEKVLGQIYACAGLVYEPVEIHIEQYGAVGATHCLLPETVAANFKALQATFSKPRRGSLSEFIHGHNAYTLWVVQIFMLATGCRAIRNPLCHLDDLDSERLMGALSDKDSGDRHMSRLICLPEVVKRQLGAYYAHCDEVARQLTGYLPPEPAVSQWERGFFLKQVGHEIRRDLIRPGIMMQVMSQIPGYIPHRANAFRKFVRTELTERECSAEVLSAYMGHWLRGEEPQDVFSSFCPSRYADTLEQFLGQLIRDLDLSFKRSAWRAN